MQPQRRLLKVDPDVDLPEEGLYDLEYYRSLSTAQRFRMAIERSILLLHLAQRHATDRKAPLLTKRR